MWPTSPPRAFVLDNVASLDAPAGAASTVQQPHRAGRRRIAAAVSAGAVMAGVLGRRAGVGRHAPGAAARHTVCAVTNRRGRVVD